MSTQLDSVVAYLGDRPPTSIPVPGEGRVVVVGSGKGGVGTSTVAALLALVVAARGERVLLVDAADGHGVQHLLLGAGPSRGLRAVGRQVEPEELVVRVTPRLSLLPAGELGGEEPGNGHAAARALFRRLSGIFDGYDLVVIDGGSRLQSVLTACEAGVSLLLAVTTADRICLAATYALVKSIGMRMDERPVAILGNRIDEVAGREAADLVDSATAHFLQRSVDFAGVLPDDACLAAGVAAGMPIQDAASGSPAATAMQVIAQTLMNESLSVPVGMAAGQLQRRQ